MSLTVMSLSLVAVAHTSSRLIDAQRAQFAADASAISCLATEQDQAYEAAESFAAQNSGQLRQLDAKADQCTTVVQSRTVVRRAVALSVHGFDLPTLKR